MIAMFFAFIEVLLNIVADVLKKFVGAVLLITFAICALFFGAILTIIYVLT